VPPIFGHVYLGVNCAPVPTLYSPDKAISAISVKMSFAQRKEMTFDRRVKTLGLQLFLVYIALPPKI